MNIIENSNSSRFTEAGAELTLKVCRRVMQELEAEEQGDASDKLRIVVTNYVEDSVDNTRNMTALRLLRDRLNKVDPADWPQDMEAEFKKIKAEEVNNNREDDVVSNHAWIKKMNKIFTDDDPENDVPEGDDELEMSQASIYLLI